MTKLHKNSVPLCLCAFVLLSSLSIQAAEIQKITRITSDKMEMNWSKNVAVFIGNALLVDEGGMLQYSNSSSTNQVSII